MRTVFLTGAAGFIGAKTAEKLLNKGITVIGLDNLNDYYDVRLKHYRLKELKKNKNFIFYKADIENYSALNRIFREHQCDAVMNFAARAGVRYSMEDPFVYFSTNSNGTLNLLELCRKYNIKKFVLASSSSLYAGQKIPFKESLAVNTPRSPYAASKKSAEVLSFTYHYLYKIDVTIFRYFTVYGPAGRPDMSPFRFIKWIDEGKPVQLFGDGSQSRDFTFVDDIAEGTIKGLKKIGFKTINLGGNKPYHLMDMIAYLEELLGKKASIHNLAFHKTDMKATWADISEAKKVLNWAPKIGFKEGLQRTVAWYLTNKKWLANVKI